MLWWRRKTVRLTLRCTCATLRNCWFSGNRTVRWFWGGRRRNWSRRSTWNRQCRSWWKCCRRSPTTSRQCCCWPPPSSSSNRPSRPNRSCSKLLVLATRASMENYSKWLVSSWQTHSCTNATSKTPKKYSKMPSFTTKITVKFTLFRKNHGVTRNHKRKTTRIKSFNLMLYESMGINQKYFSINWVIHFNFRFRLA